MLPNFLFLGPDKSGSTWLYWVLRTHPQVFLTPAKDTYFFDREYGRGLNWYERQFRGAGPQHSVIGEICHDYLFSDEAAIRIAADLPDAKLMVCLREPAERAYSAYLNIRRNGMYDGTFAEALDDFPELIGNARYAAHLQRYLAVFPRDRILVAWFDDLRADPQAFLNEITDFLGIDHIALADTAGDSARGAAEARSRSAARLVKWGALVARSWGLASIIGRIKTNARVQRLLYRQPDSAIPAMAEREARSIRDALSGDLAALPELLSSDLPPRWPDVR